MATKTIYKVKGPEGGSFAVQDASGTAQMVLNGTAITSTPADLNAVVTTSGAQTISGAKTFSANPVLATGIRFDLASATATLSSNAATITEYAAVITTEALTTASAGSQAFTITKTGTAAGDLAMVQYAGGTNTIRNITFNAVTSTDTITVTVYNNSASALNGTLIFNLIVFKA